MWAQVVNFFLGIWLMASPGIIGYAGKAADNDNIIGPVVATFAMISWWECTRGVRLWNIPLGAWLLLAPWLLGYNDLQTTLNNLAVGVFVIVFSLVEGKIEGRFGGGWSSLWQSDSEHEQEARKIQRSQK